MFELWALQWATSEFLRFSKLSVTYLLRALFVFSLAVLLVDKTTVIKIFVEEGQFLCNLFLSLFVSRSIWSLLLAFRENYDVRKKFTVSSPGFRWTYLLRMLSRTAYSLSRNRLEFCRFKNAAEVVKGKKLHSDSRLSNENSSNENANLRQPFFLSQ